VILNSEVTLNISMFLEFPQKTYVLKCSYTNDLNFIRVILILKKGHTFKVINSEY